MFLAKRGRPDIFTGISFLSIHVTKPTESDWKKFIRFIACLKITPKLKLILEADGDKTFK